MTAKIRYLTKSRFKIGSDCARKLAYQDDESYANSKSDDSFLKALAEGGFQVGELAKLYHPGGHMIESLDHAEAVAQTNELLKQENVTIFEAAILFENLFVRVDILEKNGKQIRLKEVKAKSYDSTEEFNVFNKNLKKKGIYQLNADYSEYVLDVAFQTYVMQKAFPHFSVTPILMMADKSVRATVDGVNQLFLISNDNGRSRVTVSKKAKTHKLGAPVLTELDLTTDISHILNDVVFEDYGPFNELVNTLSSILTNNTKVPAKISSSCKTCEFRIKDASLSKALKSGFNECLKEAKKITDEDLKRDLVFEIWNFRSQKAIDAGKLFSSELTEDDFSSTLRKDERAGLTSGQRQLLQVQMDRTSKDAHIATDDLRDELQTLRYPINFIDFETAMVPIPFTRGRRPYEQLAYQFSHHRLHEDGRLEHFEYLDKRVGTFPNFDFVRALKKSLEGDDGVILRFAAHENTVLNQIHEQLSGSDESDRDALMAWIESITTPSQKSEHQWVPTRQFVDMREITLRHYYLPETAGSNSIKRILPAVLNYSGRNLQKKFPDWIQINEAGRANDPYKLLKPILDDVPPEELAKVDFFLVENEKLNDGGAAMLAWSRMQFTEMSDLEREKLAKALLQYCHLDTLAMVMIWEWWQHEIKQAA